MNSACTPVEGLPDDVLLLVFEMLDISSVEAARATCRRWRRVGGDRRLQILRLRGTRGWLEGAVARRPSPDDLYARHILLSRTQLAPTAAVRQLLARTALERVIARDRLQRRLAARPPRDELVRRGILKQGGALAGAAAAVMRAQAQGAIGAVYAGDGREHWLALAVSRGILVTRDPEPVGGELADRPSVEMLVRQFSNRRTEPVVSARARYTDADPPARARVLTLRRRFELASQSQQPQTHHQPLQRQRTGVQTGIVAAVRAQFAQLGASDCPRPLVRQCTGVTAGIVRRLRQQFVL